jgi:hypothetical protein
VGFHGIYLVALQTAKLGSACAVGHGHQDFVALLAAVVIHGFLPAWRKSRRENIIWVSDFNRKSTGIIQFIDYRIQECRRQEPSF